MTVLNDGLIKLNDVRLSFPSIVEPSASAPNAQKKYNATFLMEPDSEDFADFMKQVKIIATDKWKEHADKVLEMIQNDRKLRCYFKGEEVIDKKTFKPYSGYEGRVGVSANNQRKPQLVRTDGQLVNPQDDLEYQRVAGEMYAGCYVNVIVRPWVQDNQHGRGIRCQLEAIQFSRDGEEFGATTPDLSGVFGATTKAKPSDPDISGDDVPFNF